MMDNLNLKPQSPDEVKTMMWTGENQREMEKDLVHELLHCKYDWMGCQGRTYEGVYLDATEHQKLEEMAKSLIMAKYGVDYNYFM